MVTSTVLPPATCDLSIVIPLFNEEMNVARLMVRIFGVLEEREESFEVIGVNDGSSDGTLEALERMQKVNPRLRIVPLESNVGQHRALLAGFRASRGRWVVTLDADLQNPPEEIPRVLDALQAGHDKVGTYRHRRQDPLFRKLSSRAINIVARKLSGIEIRDFGCMLRGYSREVIEKTLLEEHESLHPYVPASAYRNALRPVELPVDHVRREHGESKYDFTRLVRLSVDLLANSTKRPRKS